MAGGVSSLASCAIIDQSVQALQHVVLQYSLGKAQIHLELTDVGGMDAYLH